MKLKLNYISFSVIIFIILFILRLCWLFVFLPDDNPVAKKGEVNINHKLIQEDEYMYIEGEWLLIDENGNHYVRANSTKQTFGEKLSLVVNASLTDAISSSMTIQIPSSVYKTQVYIDGVLVKEQTAKHGLLYQTYNVDFVPEEKGFQIKIEVDGEGKNIEYPFFNHYIAISSEDGVELRSELNNIFRVSVTAVFMMMLLALIVIYCFIVNSRLFLYLILIYLFPTIGELYTLALPYIDWIKLPYVMDVKLYNIVYFLSQFSIILLLKFLSGKHKIPNINLIIALYGVTFILLLLLPINYIDIASIYLIVFYGIWIVYCFSHLLRFYIISKYEMYSLIYIGLSVISGLMWGVIKNNIYYNIPFYVYDYIGIQLGFAGFWFNRFIQNANTLRKADIKKEEFLQQVSEQLSIPLNKLELELDEHYSAINDPNEKEKLLGMTTTVRGMSFILSNWLDYTKLKDKVLKSQKQPIDIVATLKYVTDALKDALKLPDLRLTVRHTKDIPIILADSKLLSQAIYNLIYFQLESMNIKSVYIGCAQNTQDVVVKIEDASKKGQNKYIWSSETDVPISLQICDSIITEMGGNLEVKENGFTIRLPKQEQSVDYSNQYEEIIYKNVEVNEAEGNSILVYSTEINTLSSLQSVSKGDNITQVSSYDDFMRCYTNQSWDLIVLESTLSDSSSLNILTMIRTRFNLIELPVLMVLVPTTINFISTYFQAGMNDYITRPIHTIEMKYKLQILMSAKKLLDQRLQLEASLLQNQVEPHFLFNTLNSIASLSKIDVDRMVMLLEQFGQYLSRGFKKRLLKKLIDLQDEIEIVRSYLYIEELRYEPYLKVVWDVDDVINAQIPPYSIQTIVENAIKHGIRKKKHGGTIKISVKRRRTFVEVTVEDDGIGMNAEKLDSLLKNDMENGIGIYNTHIRLLNSLGTGLHIESESDKGTKVSVNLPYNKK